MKKFLFAAVAVLSVSVTLDAQHVVDVVSLRGGVELRGEVVARDSSGIVFRTTDGSLRKSIDAAEINGEWRETLNDAQYRAIGGKVLPQPPEPSSRRRGYAAFVEFGAGLGSWSDVAFELSTSQGWFITPDIFVGAVAGAATQVMVPDGPRSNSVSIPLGIAARYYFMNSRRCSPYLDLKAGYELPVLDALYRRSDGYVSDRNENGEAYRMNGPFAALSAGVEFGRFSVRIEASVSRVNYARFDEAYLSQAASVRWQNAQYYIHNGAFDVGLGIGYRF